MNHQRLFSFVSLLIFILFNQGLQAQTSFIGTNQYAFQYQPGGSPTLVGLFFNSNDNRFEFRDAAGQAELSINPISQVSNFRGKLGVNAPNPASSFQVIGNTRLGSGANYGEFDATGNLRFYGSSKYIVPGNSYAFQAFSSSIGLYFNQTQNRFEFLNSSGIPALTLGASGSGVGNLAITGEFNIGGVTGQARISALASSGTQQAAIKGKGVNDFTVGYLGVLGTNGFDGTALNAPNFEIGALGIATGSSSGLTDNYGVYGFSDNVGVRGQHSGGNFAELGRSDFAILANGPSRLIGPLTADNATLSGVIVNNNLDPSPSQDGPLLIGAPGGIRLSIYKNTLQAANAGGAANLDINPFGGTVNIGQGGGLVNIASTGSGNVAIGTGGGIVNLSNLVYANSPNNRVGIRAVTPAYTLTVRHPTGTLSKNGIAIINELNNTTWHMYSFVDGSLGLFNSDSLKGRFDNVSGNYLVTSDLRLKSGIEDIEPLSQKMAQLQPRQYRFRSDEGQHLYYGFIAQELETVFPELVHQDGETGLRTVSYTELIPLSIAVWQEEAQRNQEQESAISDLKKDLTIALERISDLENALSVCCQGQHPDQGSQRSYEGSGENQPSLGQNIPNPFGAMTSIPYFLPRGSGPAEIRVMDLNGQIRERIVLSDEGSGQVQFRHEGWASGIYLYGLFVQGRPVQMREMVLSN